MKYFRLAAVALLALSLNGCLAAAVGAGAGYYGAKNYDVSVDKKDTSSSDQTNTNTDTESDNK